MGASALARSSGAHLTWPDCKHLPCPSDGRSSTFPIPPNFAKTFPYCRRGMPAACAAALRTATHAGREGGLLQRKANQDACLAAVGFKGHAAQSLFGVFDGHGPVGVPAEWMCVSIARAVHAGIQAHITSQNTGLRQERPTCMYLDVVAASTAAKRGRSFNPRSNPVGTVFLTESDLTFDAAGNAYLIVEPLSYPAGGIQHDRHLRVHVDRRRRDVTRAHRSCSITIPTTTRCGSSRTRAP